MTPAERERLVLDHLAVAGHFARRAARDGLDREDLFQEGVLGLLEAAGKFDPERGFVFKTFAGAIVRARVADAVRRERGNPRNPSGRARAAARFAALDLDHVVDDRFEPPEAPAVRSDETAWLDAAAGRLPTRYAALLRDACGLGGRGATTWEAASLRLGKSKSWGTVLRSRALESLRERIGPEMAKRGWA